MTPHDQLDLALGRLEPPRLEECETIRDADPALAERLGRLTQTLDALLDDGRDGDLEPPFGLAHRTILLVNQERAAASGRTRRNALDLAPVRFPFGFKDLAVAAGVLLCTLATLMPAIHRKRAQLDQVNCGFNLQQLGVGLLQYANINQSFPNVPVRGEHLPAGTFAVLLQESGLLTDPKVLHCPCNSQCTGAGHPLPGLAQILALRDKDPARLEALLEADYAYHVGYRMGPGQRIQPIAPSLSEVMPIVADAPPVDRSRHRVLEGNSPNHARRGQNVLFSDGHVRWAASRRISPVDPDMFLNARSQSGPGINPFDSALLPFTFPIADDF